MSQSGGGSQHNDSSSGGKTITIKIASKDPHQRNSAGGADPGPGDMNAAPSEVPEVMDIPEPPTSSQLVVKSTSTGAGAGSSQKLATMNALRSGTGGSAGGALKSAASLGPSGSHAGPAASNPSVAAGREPTSSRPLTGPSENMSSAGKSISGAGGSTAGGASGVVGTGPSGMGSSRGSPKAIASPGGTSGASEVHDEDEEGEGELETEPSPGPSGASTPATSPKSGAGSASSQFGPGKSGKSMSGAPVSSSAKSGGAGGSSVEPSKSGPKSSGPLVPSSAAASSKSGKKDDKKVTRFRYHKRITVRTHGKTNPSTIMSKVNKGVTPSTIDELDPKELMKRAGIKNTKHWRIRLRQTKRITKNGKTTTQTKVAYRDSSGNKVVPNCKKCGKKLDECKCDKPQPDR